jgi:hypothetical protein
MDILLLSGWSGAGKDYIADLFSTYGFIKYTFAEELKKAVSKKYDIPLEQTLTQEGKQSIHSKTGRRIRDILIEEAKELRYMNGDGYFAECVAKTILESSFTKAKIVISDWRFPVELETLCNVFENQNQNQNVRFHTIRISRSGQTCSPVPDTYSENQLDFFPFHHHLENDENTNISSFLDTLNLLSAIEKPCDAAINDGTNA